MDLIKLTKPQLVAKCKELGIKKYSNKKKDELIELINNSLSKNIELIIQEDGADVDHPDSKENDDVDVDVDHADSKENDEVDVDVDVDVDHADSKENDECNENDECKQEDDNIKLTSKQELKKNKEKLLNEIECLTTEPFINDNVSLYCGDCIVEMNKIENDSVGLILCDLPYGTTKCKWDTIIDLNELWKHYKRIIKKPSGVILLFGQQPFTSMLISSNYKWFKYNLIWKKNKTTQFLLANYRPMKCTEDICVFSKGGAAAASKTTGNMTYNPQGLIPTNIKKKNSKERIGKMLNQEHHLGKNNKLTGSSEYTQHFTNYPNELIEFDIEFDTIHETQKPVKLIEHLIKTYSNEGDVVLDNTMGSGTTGVGCLNTNRKFIGIEKEEKYFKLSKYRITACLN
jgi:site-specific DNA-methyltransferase (adenine-specific)